MIYQLAQDVAAKLALREYPVRVFYGPERVSRDCPSTSSITVVIERDTVRGDAVRAASTTRANPRLMRVRDVGCVATIMARSSLPGARTNEHESDCDQVVDALIVALAEWGAENAAGAVEFAGGRYLSPDEIAGAERLAGVVYQIQFRVSRGVLARNYDGTAQPTAALLGTTLGTRVSLDGVNFEDI